MTLLPVRVETEQSIRYYLVYSMLREPEQRHQSLPQKRLGDLSISLFILIPKRAGDSRKGGKTENSKRKRVEGGGREIRDENTSGGSIFELFLLACEPV